MKFDQNILGHTLPQKIIYHAITQDKLGHAYLFAGEEGIGKKTIAYAIATTLLCKEAVPFCGQCSSCLKCKHKTHPDLIEILPDGHFIKISQIKQIQDQINFQPFYGPKKIFIIDDADRMNLEAANCFLKSIEEPPGKTHFFLISSRPQMILPTLLSRCQQIRFTPPSQEEVVTFLEKVKNFSLDEAIKIAKRSEGKLGVALSINLKSLEEEDETYLKLIHPDTLASPSTLFRFSEELARDGDHLKKTLEWISCWVRDMILWKSCKNAEYLFFNHKIEEIEKYSALFSLEKLYHCFHFIQKMEKLVTRNLNRALVLESFLLQLSEGIKR